MSSGHHFRCCFKFLQTINQIMHPCIIKFEQISFPSTHGITSTSQLTKEQSQPKPTRRFKAHHDSVVVLYSSSLVYVVVPITVHTSIRDSVHNTSDQNFKLLGTNKSTLSFSSRQRAGVDNNAMYLPREKITVSDL